MNKNFKQFTVKEDSAFRLRVETWECLRPEGLFSVNFINECLNKDGEVDFASRYNFFLTKEEMKTISKEWA